MAEYVVHSESFIVECTFSYWKFWVLLLFTFSHLFLFLTGKVKCINAEL